MPNSPTHLHETSSSVRPRVAVVGGGLAGLAAAVGLAENGVAVELFETRGRLGGRAGSIQDAQTGRWIDHCQHVSMGCCANLADFRRRVGIDDSFECHRRYHFFGPDGRRSDLAATPGLPAPLHLAPGLLRLKYLGPAERWRILRAMTQLARPAAESERDEETVEHWLRRHGQSDRAIERFWSIVLVSALSETLDRASLRAARKVFVDGFLNARRAYELEVPRLPLVEIFDSRLTPWLVERGVTIHRHARVAQVETDATTQLARSVVLRDGSRREADFVVVAVPWHRVRGLFAPETLVMLPELACVDQIQSAPITAVHLWFDRRIADVPHAVLVDRLGQWVFQPDEDYCQVVISASGGLRALDRRDVVQRAAEELRATWPEARSAKLLHGRVITEPAAVFSVCPGTERLRPRQTTSIRNLVLAGDWTATGWPATMEGAVRSGNLAAEAILSRLGRETRLLADDVPRGWLSRLLFGPRQVGRQPGHRE